jgi:hypothetical protein
MPVSAPVSDPAQAPLPPPHESLQYDPSNETQSDDNSSIMLKPAAWHAALTVRGFLVAAVLGAVFCIITIKLNLGSAGMTPSLNIAGAKV